MTTFLLIFLLSLPFSFSLRCFKPPNLLPARRDCRAIIAGINWLSTRPSENYPRSWGRHLHTTSTTERLPKTFSIEGRRPPNLCGVEVDVDPLDFYAIDDFRLTELATAAARVYAVCLMGRAMIGLEYPGREKKVWAKLVKLDYIPPLAGQSREGGLVRPLGVLDDGTTLVVREGGLQEASRNTTVVESQ